jgi:hypothetical protein
MLGGCHRFVDSLPSTFATCDSRVERVSWTKNSTILRRVRVLHLVTSDILDPPEVTRARARQRPPGRVLAAVLSSWWLVSSPPRNTGPYGQPAPIESGTMGDGQLRSTASPSRSKAGPGLTGYARTQRRPTDDSWRRADVAGLTASSLQLCTLGPGWLSVP